MTEPPDLGEVPEHTTRPDSGERDALSAFDAERQPTTRALLRLVGRHPAQMSEYLVLFSVRRQAPEIRSWVQRHGAVPGSPQYEELLDELRHDSVGFARLNGALAGTPLFISLVPAYLTVLSQQARMALRIAALNGNDPGDPKRAAELLVITGVYPSVDQAAAALKGLSIKEPEREKGPRSRTPVRRFIRAVGGLDAWVELVKQVLTLAGFLESSPDKVKPSRARQILDTVISIAVWVLTWIIPVLFMLLMAWDCEKRTREVFDRALATYGEPGAEGAWRGAMKKWRRQRPLRYLLVLLAVAVPFGVIGYAAETGASGTSWLRILAVLLGLMVTLTLTGIVTRRQ
jgi:hypothetical protein